MADKALAARLVAHRVGVGALTLLIVSAVIFTITGLLPGDAAQEALGQSATPETVAALRAQFGLDKPPYVRYFNWLWGLLTGNLGQSFTAAMPVSELIATRLPKSLILAAVTAARVMRAICAMITKQSVITGMA